MNLLEGDLRTYIYFCMLRNRHCNNLYYLNEQKRLISNLFPRISPLNFYFHLFVIIYNTNTHNYRTLFCFFFFLGFLFVLFVNFKQFNFFSQLIVPVKSKTCNVLFWACFQHYSYRWILLQEFNWNRISMMYHNNDPASGEGNSLCYMTLSAMFTVLRKKSHISVPNYVFDETSNTTTYPNFKKLLKKVALSSRSK